MSSAIAPDGRMRPTFRDGTLSQTFITVKVGPDEEPFNLHKDLLCYYSGHFRAALNGSFREAEEGMISLADTDTQTFGIVADWFYTQQLPEDDDSLSLKVTRHEGPRDAWDEMLTDVYVFADRYNIPRLKQDALDAFHNVYMAKCPGGVPLYNTIIKAFAHLPEKSPFLSYLVDLYAYRFDPEYDGVEEAKVRPQLPKEFLLRLVLVYAERVKETKEEEVPYKVDICQYHEHTNDEERKACKERRGEEGWY